MSESAFEGVWLLSCDPPWLVEIFDHNEAMYTHLSFWSLANLAKPGIEQTMIARLISTTLYCEQ